MNTVVSQAVADSSSESLLPDPRRILVAVDASDCANRALHEASRLAVCYGGTVTGIHAYAARLHDQRFRQMEGGLPEQYRAEDALEHQRTVHDDLITRGLGIVSEGYHDAAALVCDKAGVPYRRLSPEGKNYRRIVEATADGAFDLLILGAQGLGAVPGSLIGSVCERVARRSPIDMLVIRDALRGLCDGPLVAALDGSPRSFGAFRLALALSRHLGVAVHAVAAYDPYFHYVAFQRIAGVLNEESSRQFRFREQEQLHESIIDDGLAKIYRSHLDIAATIARDAGVDLTLQLLEGKPWQAIATYARGVNASLLLLGKTGIHADPELDIGSNAECLLRIAPCHVWLSRLEYVPPLEAVARETIAWTKEAEQSLARVPEMAREMARMAVLRFVQAKGHTLVTSALVAEATRALCPHGRRDAGGREDLPWSEAAQELLDAVSDVAMRQAVRLRAEKCARTKGADRVYRDHIQPFVGAPAMNIAGAGRA